MWRKPVGEGAKRVTTVIAGEVGGRRSLQLDSGCITEVRGGMKGFSRPRSALGVLDRICHISGRNGIGRTMTATTTTPVEAGRDFIRDIVQADLAAGRHRTIVTRFP